MAGPTTSAASADAKVPPGDSPSSLVMRSVKEEWTTRDLFEAGEEEKVRVKRFLCALQESCCVKGFKVPESVSKEGGLAAGRMMRWR